MDSSPELKILLKYHEQVVVIIRNNLEEIARYLRRNDVITRQIYREATYGNSYHTDHDRAKIILRRLEDKVEEDTRHYYIFYSYLESKKEYSKLTALISEKGVPLNRKGSCYECNYHH